MKEPARALAAGLFPGKQGIRIDRRTVPPMLAGRHLVDREMQVRTGRASISGMPDLGNHLAALDLLPFMKARRVSRKVRIIISPFLVGGAFVDRHSAPNAIEQ